MSCMVVELKIYRRGSGGGGGPAYMYCVRKVQENPYDQLPSSVLTHILHDIRY